MENSKSWYQSTSVWGSVFAIGAGVAQMTGHTIPPELVGDAANLATQAVAVGGGIVGLWGRIRATTRLGK